MAVVVDATGTKLITTVAGASVNYTGITVGSGANRALVVTVACGAAVTAPNAHWDTAGTNQAMTLIGSLRTQTNVTTFMFGLRNPTPGLKTLNVAWTTSAVSNIEAISFTGAETTSDAKAFINNNFAVNGGTVASISIGLTSPADSIGVASYATSATFSSITQTNIFTDTTNTGCEGGASRANGAGASILFTGSDTTTTGNKVMVGFVVAAPTPVLSEPWQNPPFPGHPPALAQVSFATHEQPFLAWSTFTPAAATTPITAAGTSFDSDIIFPYKLIYQAKTDPLVFTVATTPTGWNDPLEQPVRNWWRSSIYSAPFLALGVPPAQVWFPPNVTPDFAPAARRPVNYLPWTFIEPPQVWYPPDVYPDTVPVRKKPAPDFIPWTFLEPAPQVWFPYDRWPDTAPAAKRVAQNPDWSYGTFITPTATTPYTQWTQWPDFAPRARPAVNAPFSAFLPLVPSATVIADWPDFAQRKQPPLDTQLFSWSPTQFTTVAPTMAWTNWPDFAPKAKPLVDIRPWTFVPTPQQVFFPYAPWDDFTRRKPQYPDTQPLAWTGQNIAAPAPAMGWINWPDFAPRARRVADFIPWTFLEPAPQVFSPYWPWDDFARRQKPVVDFIPWTFVAPTLPTVWTQWTPWPDLVPTRKKPAADFIPWTFIPPPAQVFFPYWSWDDFARKKPQPLDTQPLIWSTFTPAPTFFLVPDRWPDFAAKKKPPLNYDPLAFLQTITSPFNSFVNWPDFATKKKPPLNYVPLTFVQTIRTPWNTMTTWPDFAPIRGKRGLAAASQQSLIWYPKLIATTVTITMSAFEVNTDGAAAAILVVQSQPAVDAAVSIQEIGILGGSVTP